MKTITFKVAKQHQARPVEALGEILGSIQSERPAMNLDRCQPGSKTMTITYKEKDERVIRAAIELYEARHVGGN